MVETLRPRMGIVQAFMKIGYSRVSHRGLPPVRTVTCGISVSDSGNGMPLEPAFGDS